MLRKGQFKWDRNRKPIEKFKSENFEYTGKKCSYYGCNKRKSPYHHYLCEYHHKLKEQRYKQRNKIKN